MTLPTEVSALLQKHWGFPSLRPLQQDAIAATLAGRDALVVLPTGGGKSLCYQLPAVVRGGLTVVVSPLIALMKDQVDALTRIGVPAVRLDSTLDERARFLAEQAVRDGEARLAFTSPERLINGDVVNLFRDANAHTVAIDEAHCVSHWGHDFRPEYRQLARLREFFPAAAVQAYTATATKQVQTDILLQLGLRNPHVLVGNFDRPNLTFRVLPQIDLVSQVREVLDRHKGSGGIIYCLRRKDVDGLAALLARFGYKAVAYHAGMTGEERKLAQDAFVNETADVVVATIAFGMGIDRSNVRFVLHAAMPKSIEHYQQETGRAGRDGLPAECVLLFSGGDVMGLRRLVQTSNAEKGVDPEITAATLGQIDEMSRFCRGAVCRHRAIVNYFGQDYANPNCGACDICLGDTDAVPDATLIAQKILSCVARVQEGFGINHVIEVLRGSEAKPVRERGHDKLTTWGLLRDSSPGELRDFIHQLIGQGLLMQSTGDYPVLKLTPGSWEVMKNQRSAILIRMKAPEARKGKVKGERPEGVDDGLFEELRALRKRIAAESGAPPYIVFTDNVLLEFARGRPSTLVAMRRVSGVGDQKLRDYGDAFLNAILEYAKAHNLSMDVPLPRGEAKPVKVSARLSPAKQLAFEMFRESVGLDAVMAKTGMARSTVCGYLTDYIVLEKPKSIRPWVNAEDEERIRAAAKEHGSAFLKPIHEALKGAIEYAVIRFVLAHQDRDPLPHGRGSLTV